MSCATCAQSAGYDTGRSWPAAPNARSGSTTTRQGCGRDQHEPARAARRGDRRCARRREPRRARATARTGSVTSGRPGAVRHRARGRPSTPGCPRCPGSSPSARARTLPAASMPRRPASVGGHRRLSTGQPMTARMSSAAVTAGTSTLLRLAGVVCAFQIPPVPSTAPIGPLQFSPRAENATTPAGSDCPAAAAVRAAANHGALSPSTVATAAVTRIHDPPTIITTTTAKAIVPPVGVIAHAAPATTSLAHATRGGSAPVRRSLAARASHGRAA